jgi:glycosyltransferase involved in cell wall biosynthesis
MRPLRITYVVHQFLPRYFTGTEQYTFAVARAMQERGHDVDVWSLDPQFGEADELWHEDRETVEGLPVTRFRHWMMLTRDFARHEHAHPLAAARFGRHLDERRPDLVHAFHLRHVGADLLQQVSLRGIASVVHLMDFWFMCPAVTLLRSDGALCDGPPEGGLGCIDCVDPDLGRALDDAGMRRALAQWAPHATPPSPTSWSPFHRGATYLERPRWLREQLLRAERIVAPSHFLRSVFVRNGYAAERIEVIGYGVDPARLGTRAARPPRIAGTPLRVGFFGSLSPHKGVDVAVDAVLRTPGPIELHLFGRTTDFPAFAETLRARAAADPRIRFEPPFPRERLGEALATIDVLAVPSRWYENTPFVVLEAFAGGVPVLASDLGGLRELVTDGVNGELFPRGDAAALSTRLARLRDEPDRLQRYRGALPRVKTIGENATEIERVYREVAPRGAS